MTIIADLLHLDYVRGTKRTEFINAAVAELERLANENKSLTNRINTLKSDWSAERTILLEQIRKYQNDRSSN